MINDHNAENMMTKSMANPTQSVTEVVRMCKKGSGLTPDFVTEFYPASYADRATMQAQIDKLIADGWVRE